MRCVSKDYRRGGGGGGGGEREEEGQEKRLPDERCIQLDVPVVSHKKQANGLCSVKASSDAILHH